MGVKMTTVPMVVPAGDAGTAGGCCPFYCCRRRCCYTSRRWSGKTKRNKASLSLSLFDWTGLASIYPVFLWWWWWRRGVVSRLKFSPIVPGGRSVGRSKMFFFWSVKMRFCCCCYLGFILSTVAEEGVGIRISIFFCEGIGR